MTPDSPLTSPHCDPVIRPEEVIAQIWAEVMDLDEVKPDDDFFELGGDSLHAVQILSRISKRFQFKLSEGELFTARTPRGLYELLGSAGNPENGPALVAQKGDPRPTHFPATSAQRRLWFLDRFIANPEVYNVPFLVAIQGDLDPLALAVAFSRLEQRHEALRTRLVERDGLPEQEVLPAQTVSLPVHDLRNLPESKRRETAIQEATHDAKTPFALSGERLYRLKLYRTGADEHLLYLNFHHAITDGWSWGILFKDLEEFYEAERNKRSDKLAPLPVQYGDYALWQREWVQSEACREQVKYWKEALGDHPTPINLPFAKPRPKMQSFQGGWKRFEISKKLQAAIDKLARECSTTRFMIGLAALETVLHRYTGQDDLLIGTPVAGRNKAEIEPLVGMFVNTLVLRTNLADKPTFLQLLERIRVSRLGAFAHQEVPLELLIEEIRPPRDTSRQPFFQMAFLYQNMTIIPPRMGRHKLTNLPIHNGTSMFDLRLVLEDGPFGSLWGWLEYNTNLFDADSMERLIGHFLHTLEQACANPQQNIEQISILPPAERRQLLQEFNRTQHPYPADDLIHSGFERCVQATPDAVALVTKKETLTYRQLNDRANQLARYLQQQGVAPKDYVGVCLSRSPQMIVSVLAIVKLGAAYVPLDPNYPNDRLTFMIHDTKAKRVLTESGLADRLEGVSQRLCLDQLQKDLEKYSTEPLPISVHPKDTAYIIYTSGSTGTPKGVVLSHTAVVNTLDWVNRECHVTAADRLLFVTSLSFDLSVYDIFGGLGSGASLRIASEEELRDPALLTEILSREAITIWNSAPAALLRLTSFFPKEPSQKLRLVMLSGDWIPVALPDQVRRAFPNAQVLSLGGATEAAIWSNTYPIGTVDPTWPSIPYGKPIQNTRYYVLNGNLEPQPIGVPGELYITGVGLADGYHDRPELTAERFIPNPHAQPEEGPEYAKMYRTGDLGRYFPDGNLEFLGRIDHQVKVRGYRVELGEIEATLSSHPMIQTAVVRPFRDASNTVYLVAYAILKGQTTANELAKFLQVKLPEYMVPAHFVFLDSFPTTANGKLDRAALKAPDVQQKLDQNRFVPPETDAERALAPIWEEVLNVRPLSVTADFNEVGGHSLLAAQLVARIESKLGHKVPLEALFTAPTIRGMAEIITRKLELGKDLLIPLNETGMFPTLYLIAGAGGHVFQFHKFARLLGSEYPVFGMKAVGIDGSEEPLDDISTIAQRYLAEILARGHRGPFILGGYSVGGLVAYELACELIQRGYSVPRIILFDTLAPGYPPQPSLPKKVWLHTKAFWNKPNKWAYLKERYRNWRKRKAILAGSGKDYVEGLQGVDVLSDEIYRKVWAGLERARMNYMPTQRLANKIVMVRSETPMDWGILKLDDPANGWNRWTTKPVDVLSVPVGHMEIFEDKNLNLLLRQVREVIIEATEELAPAPTSDLKEQLAKKIQNG